MKRAALSTRFFWATAVALLLPWALTVARVTSHSFSDWTAQVGLSWLWMAAPQLPFIVAGGLSPRLRPWMGLPMTLLSLLLLSYQAWVQWGCPAAERDLARMLYTPFALPVVLLTPLIQFGWHRLNKHRGST